MKLAAAAGSFGWLSFVSGGLGSYLFEQGIQFLWLSGLHRNRHASQLGKALLAGRHIPCDRTVSEGSSEEMNPGRQNAGIDQSQ